VFSELDRRFGDGHKEMCALVGPEDVLGGKALVVGGSRGLGEEAAKLLAAGGADRQLTYHRRGE
jgi:hypothetical protein